MLPEDIRKAIQKFKITYGIQMDGVKIFLSPSTFSVCFNQFINKLPFLTRIKLKLMKKWFEFRKKPISMDVDWIPVMISDLVPNNEIIIVRKPEEVIKYETRDATIIGHSTTTA